MSLVMNYFIIAITHYSIIYWISTLSSEKIKSWKRYFLAIALLSGIELFLAKYNNIINVLFSFLVTYSIVRIFLRLSLKKSIYYTLIVFSFGLIIDVLMMALANLISLNNIHDASTKNFFSLIMCIIYLILSRISFLKKAINKLIEKIDKFKEIILMITLFLMLNTICIRHIDSNIIVLIMLYDIVMFAIFSIIYLYQKYKALDQKNINKILVKDSTFYLEKIEEYQIMKHNIMNKLLGIKNVSNEKTNKLIDNLILEYKQITILPNELRNIPIGINGVILEKISNYSSYNLNTNINIKLKNDLFSILSARSYNSFYEILGVTLDNALEASSKSHEKILYIQINETSDFIKTEIINSFVGTIDIDRLGTKNYTSSKNGHGIGLYSLYKRNKHKIITEIKNNLFYVKIIIEKIKKWKSLF